jgi:hypothetical protein
MQAQREHLVTDVRAFYNSGFLKACDQMVCGETQTQQGCL